MQPSEDSERKTRVWLDVSPQLFELVFKLFIANRDADHELHILRDKIAEMRAINDGKKRELDDLSGSIDHRNHDNNHLRDKIKDIEKAIVRECDEGRSLRVEIARTNDDIEKLKADLHITENCIKNRHKDIDGLNANLNKRMIDIDDKNKDIASANHEIHRLNDNIGKAKNDQDKLKHRLDDEIDRHHRMRKENDDHCVRGHGLRGNIKDLEAQCANRDAQIHVMRDEIDKLKHALHASEDCNHNLEEELAALEKHADMLTHQNSLLNHELEDAVANEEFVRRELDRKGKVSAIQKDNDEHLRQSLHMLNEVKARSPVRRR